VTAIDPAAFITHHLRLAPIPGYPSLQRYSPHPGSGLGRLAEQHGASPYWAYLWSGGLALATWLTEHPAEIAGRRVLDYGTGSGLVAMVAAQVGAINVTAADSDPFARAAATLNAAANSLDIAVADSFPEPTGFDLVLAGDVFYDAAAASASLIALDAFRDQNIPVLVGDPGRKHLPLTRLDAIATYDVPEFGGTPGATVRSSVYRYRP
jgi:predicted nicotinamide N-methyase